MKAFKLLSLILILFSIGCMSVQKAQNYLDKKGKLAEVCAKAYPVQDSLIIKERVQVDTVTGPSYIIIDTVYVEDKPLVIHRQCPPDKVITKTIVKDTTVYRRDKAYEAVLLSELQAYNKQIKALDSMNNKLSREYIDLKKKANDWQWKAILTWIIVGAAILFIIFKRFK